MKRNRETDRQPSSCRAKKIAHSKEETHLFLWDKWRQGRQRTTSRGKKKKDKIAAVKDHRPFP